MDTIVLVTGANKGLGKETARRLAARGWTVLVGARDERRGKEAVNQLAEDGTDVHYLPMDVTHRATVDAAAGRVLAEWGRLDVLVNNAGIIGSRRSALDMSGADLRECYEVNVFGTVTVTHAFLPLLDRSSAPRLVMVSSGMGSLGVTSDPERPESGLVSIGYASSKAALNMITSQYAKALPRCRVNAVDPGYTATDLNGHQGLQTVEQGAEAIVTMATVPADGPTGTFVDRYGSVPW